MKRWQKLLLFCALSATLIGCDRVTKDIAKSRLMNKDAISYFHDTFRLIYVENTGAALSLGDSLSKTTSFWLLSILPLACLLALFVYTIRRAGEISTPRMLCYTLIFAGGMGNIIDRIVFDRHVTDFMNIGISGLRSGIFNFADVYITSGVIAFLIMSFQKKSPEAPLNPDPPSQS